MSIDKDFVEEALLRWNYLPYQKRNQEELPPVFTSRQLVPAIAQKIRANKHRKDGYDQVEYLLTRHTNVSRPLSIPHPLAYCHLVEAICSNWQYFNYVCDNENSRVKPYQHTDNRLLIMDYGDEYSNADRALRFGFGKKFRIHTDISNCFPSLYSHAIPWALVGISFAKQNRGDQHWFNKIDFCQRMLKRGETQGLGIGPATSNIVSEAILARIDEDLSKHFSYFRYIDDYTCYCETFEEGQKFIRALREQLKKYKLVLNIKKTEIVELPAPIEADWIVDLSTRLPAGTTVEKKGKVYSASEAVRYIDYAVRISSQHPDGSVLKYAVKAILDRLDMFADTQVLEYLLNLVRYYPLLLPLLEPLLEKSLVSGCYYAKYLNQIAIENAIEGRSDGICWSLYYLAKYGLLISYEVAEKVIESKDCLGILMLYQFECYDSEVLNFTNNLDFNYAYELDQYWMLLYQLFFDGMISNPYQNDKTFDILRENDVSFIERKNHKSQPEKDLEAKKSQAVFGNTVFGEVITEGATT